VTERSASNRTLSQSLSLLLVHFFGVSFEESRESEGVSFRDSLLTVSGGGRDRLLADAIHAYPCPSLVVRAFV
jgi:hypothetical protein